MTDASRRAPSRLSPTPTQPTPPSLPPATTSPRPIAVRAEGATKSYGAGATEVRALDGVTTQFPQGTFTAIMGPSGSGKSTLLHCLAGLDTLDSGQVFLGDVELGRLSDDELTRLRRTRVGFVFQSFNLVATLNAEDNIVLPLSLAGQRVDRQWLATIVDAVGLGGRLRHRPSELSGGQQQRVAVARALVTRPDVVAADEPTGNLDSRAGHDVLAFLRDATDQMGQTVVMVTHDPAAACWADTVLFLADGTLVDSIATPTRSQVLERMNTLDRAPVSAQRTATTFGASDLTTIGI